MPDEKGNGAAASTEFLCKYCGEKKQIFYDWQRCWQCYQESATRDLHSIPQVCPACCRKNHRKPLGIKG